MYNMTYDPKGSNNLLFKIFYKHVIPLGLRNKVAKAKEMNPKDSNV